MLVDYKAHLEIGSQTIIEIMFLLLFIWTRDKNSYKVGENEKDLDCINLHIASHICSS